MNCAFNSNSQLGGRTLDSRQDISWQCCFNIIYSRILTAFVCHYADANIYFCKCAHLILIHHSHLFTRLNIFYHIISKSVLLNINAKVHEYFEYSLNSKLAKPSRISASEMLKTIFW